jgi:DNA mismatch endonuclease (patch repair protein)
VADVVTPAVRSRMMAGIQGKNTRPEISIRRALFRQGFRFRLHDKRLPGKPDIVLPSYNAVIQVHGCFWHCHGCHLFKWPASNAEFWKTKINGNRKVDERTATQLRKLGWRVLVVWECALKGVRDAEAQRVVDRIVRWLRSPRRSMEIVGRTSLK